MIRAVYDRKQLRLAVEGHAGAGTYGSDPVCAAASVLVQTLAQEVHALAEQGLAEDAIMHVEPGDAVVCCRPVEGFGCTVRTIFDCIAYGLELLEAAEPAYVAFEHV